MAGANPTLPLVALPGGLADLLCKTSQRPADSLLLKTAATAQAPARQG
jgi:hypothetical protein